MRIIGHFSRPQPTGQDGKRLSLKLTPQMSQAEFAGFVSFARHSDNYMEFGAGGSTYIAAQLVRKQITSVDSSQDWLATVRQACTREECAVKPKLLFADIGPVGKWGRPDSSSRPRWPVYYEAVWEEPGVSAADLYFIDGRFRVACFVSTLLHCRADSLIMFHDFAARPQYHAVRSVAREIASFENLSVFLPKCDQSSEQLLGILDKHRFDSD